MACTGALLLMAGCNGDTSLPPPGAPEENLQPWLGRYAAVWDGRTTDSTPAGRSVVIEHLDHVVMTVTAAGANRIQIRWQIEERTETDAAVFTVSGNSATLVEGTWNKGPRTCDACSATLDGDTLTQDQLARTSGESNGLSWSGSYAGAWVGTRLP
jgi:hypothetical protein